MTDAASVRDHINQSIRAVFVKAGLKPVHIGVSFRSDGQVLSGDGFHADGVTPFAFVTKPFHGDPYQRAIAEVSRLTVPAEALIPQQQQQRNPTMSSSPASLVERIRAMQQAGLQRMATIEQEHVARVTDAGVRQDAALDKLETKLKSDRDAAEAEVKALEDQVNQLTNG